MLEYITKILQTVLYQKTCMHENGFDHTRDKMGSRVSTVRVHNRGIKDLETLGYRGNVPPSDICRLIFVWSTVLLSQFPKYNFILFYYNPLNSSPNALLVLYLFFSCQFAYFVALDFLVYLPYVALSLTKNHYPQSHNQNICAIPSYPYKLGKLGF